MSLHYVRVFPAFDSFAPAIRPTGNLVIIGDATAGTNNVAVEVTSPDAAIKLFTKAGEAQSALTKALLMAMRQDPSPTRMWGIKAGATLPEAFTAAAALDVQFVVLANTLVTADSVKTGAAIALLRDHVVTVSGQGDGKERMGVAMLAKSATDTAPVATVPSDRMVYVAHQSDDDAAAAVAGTIAGYPPYTSMILKQVAISNIPFSAAQVDTINGQEDETNPAVPSGIAGKGVVWLTSPVLIPGGATYLGEGYTGNSQGLKYIDVQRTLDDITFRLKARLIGSIGNLRISRSGLRALLLQMESVLNPLVAGGVLEGYKLTVPVLNLLDADPATLTPAQVQAVKDAHTQRVAQVLASVEYAGAMHRIHINLKFN